MTAYITYFLLYIIGAVLSHSMQRIEHEAESQTYTKGDRVLNFCLSLLSFLMVIIILTSAWVQKINKTGYWKRPVKPEPVITNKQEA